MVGLVEDGRKLASPTTRRMSGAWPPPAPSVWKAHRPRPLVAAMVFSTKPDSLSVSEWMATCTSVSSATSRQLLMAAGVVPQSSCSFRPMAPASTCSRSAPGRLALPLPRKPRFIGKASAACSMRSMFHGPGRAGGGKGAGGRAGAAAEHGGHAAGQRFFDLLRADEVDVGVDAAGGDDVALALMISVPGPMTMSTPGCVSGLPALPMAAMRPRLQADVGLDDAPVVDDQRVGDARVSIVPLARGALALRHAVADGLAAAELHLFAVAAGAQGVVFLDLDDQVGVGQAHAVADGGAEHFGVGASSDVAMSIPSPDCRGLELNVTADSGACTRPRKPYTSRSPA